jgi:polyisoprenoid-binding protein YceI
MQAEAEAALRYDVSSADSALVVLARSTLHDVRASTTALGGFVVASWSQDDTLATSPPPSMHVEFPLDSVLSGNAMQDREMLKVADARRFPKVAADLRSIELVALPGRYKATGDITLAGRSRSYGGEFTIARAGESVTVEGEIGLDIRDFGLKPPSLLILKVDPILRLRLRLVARRAE